MISKIYVVTDRALVDFIEDNDIDGLSHAYIIKAYLLGLFPLGPKKNN